MANNDDLLNNMSNVPGGGSTDKLQDPKIKAKLDQYWGQHTESKGNDSVEMMRARNTAIRLSKGLQPRGEPLVKGSLGSRIRVELNKNNYWDGLTYMFTYPREVVPGQPIDIRILPVTSTEKSFFQGGGWLGKIIREEMEAVMASKETKQGNGKLA